MTKGTTWTGKGTCLAEYVAKVLIEDFNADPALGDGGQIAHLTAILDQAITDLTMVCDALEFHPSIEVSSPPDAGV